MELYFDEMMELCEQKEELRAKEEIVDGVPVVIFSYMVQYSDTFDSELAKEFRGTTFRLDTKELISRPLPKFFNIGETEETQPHKLDLHNAEYFTKHDGSMVTPVVINGKVFWKTKNSFYSDVAQKAQAFYNKYNAINEYLDFDWRILKKCVKHYTPIFEYVAPHNRIVLEYPEEQFIYLGFRDKESGRYYPNKQLKVNDITYNDVFDMKGIEGFVIQTGCGKLVKAKTKEYLEHHKLVSEFNPKSVIQATLDDTVDDMIGVVSQLGFKDRQKEIEQLRDEVNHAKTDVMDNINHYFNQCKDVGTRKEFAQYVNDNIPSVYKGFMFLMLDNKHIEEKVDKLVFDSVYSKYKKD
jgi:RNA ligase